MLQLLRRNLPKRISGKKYPARQKGLHSNLTIYAGASRTAALKSTLLLLTVFSAVSNCRSLPRLLSCQSNSMITSGSIGLPSRAVPLHV